MFSVTWLYGVHLVGDFPPVSVGIHYAVPSVLSKRPLRHPFSGPYICNQYRILSRIGRCAIASHKISVSATLWPVVG